VAGIKANEKYNAKTVAANLRDNALYTAFAPAEKPRIAIAVVVENVGFGADYAAPIVRKALDYYLLGKRPPPKVPVPAPAAPPVGPAPAGETVPVEEAKADAGIVNHAPGGETPGNKD
jgi:penicillin-binding protein 2